MEQDEGKTLVHTQASFAGGAKEEAARNALEAAHRAYESYGQSGALRTTRIAPAHLQAVISAYLSALPVQGVGWRLVPEVPTREMLNAAIDVDSFKLGDISPLGFRRSPQMLFERCYAAMIAAAPPPLGSGSEPVGGED